MRRIQLLYDHNHIYKGVMPRFDTYMCWLSDQVEHVKFLHGKMGFGGRFLYMSERGLKVLSTTLPYFKLIRYDYKNIFELFEWL